MRQLSALSSWSYRVSGLVGVLTYATYGSLNDAWGSPALLAIALYLYLAIPGYSTLSNGVEAKAARLFGLTTAGRLCRYVLQLGVNLVLLRAFLAGGILDWSGLDGIGGFFGAAAWVTLVSQGGQYLATWLARNGVGGAERNVVLAISTSVVVNALAVSGVAWIQPIYVAASLIFGLGILLVGIVSDARSSLCGTARVPRNLSDEATHNLAH